MPDDPYALLGVAIDATRDEITDAYRTLAQIYHPDRYVEAPPRVQAEANRRMQALNAAVEQVRAATPPSTHGSPAPTVREERPQPPARPARDGAVLYVDGAKGFHNGGVAPLGVAPLDGGMQHVQGAARCGKLDAELLGWFELQRRNAGLAATQMYNAWDTAQRSSYAATMGCTRLPRDRARAFAMPCPECRP